MNEIHPPVGTTSVAVKILTIIGFTATVGVIVFLIMLGFSKAPSSFVSLANIAEGLKKPNATPELAMTTVKSVLNSEESFQISWTDLKQSGEYHFGYKCTQGVEILIRNGNGDLVPLPCTGTLTLPANVHTLFLSIASREMRFTDVPLTLSFMNEAKEKRAETELKITVVNAKVAVKETPYPAIPEKKDEPKTETTPVTTPTETPKPAEQTPAAPAAKPTPTKPVNVMYPPSDPNGTTDLQITILSTGTQVNGVYSATSEFRKNTRGAVQFDVKNIGTKRSDTWTFTVSLPNEQGYTSVTQMPLGPNEHIVSTLGFNVMDIKDPAKITTTLFTTRDTNPANNSVTKSVPVK